MRLWSRTILGVAAVALAACGGDDEPIATGAPMGAVEIEESQGNDDGVNEAPEIERISLSPESPRPGERVTVKVQTSDPDGDSVRVSYEWRINGQRVGNGPSIHTQGHPKGTVIELRAVPNDGQIEGAAEMATVRVGNQPPVMIGIKIEPLGEVTATHDIVANPTATDPDGDDLEYIYEWTINGDAAYSEEAVLPRDEFKRGDQITISVRADDGSTESEPLESQPFEVVNALPAITSSPGAFDEAGSFRYQLAVTDPDGDRRLRYRLLEGPKGMAVDLLQGMVTWTPTDSQSGTHPVVLEVDDMAGGKVTQSFQVQVEIEGSAPANQANEPSHHRWVRGIMPAHPDEREGKPG
jgi:hypothetical protein